MSPDESINGTPVELCTFALSSTEPGALDGLLAEEISEIAEIAELILSTVLRAAGSIAGKQLREADRSAMLTRIHDILYTNTDELASAYLWECDPEELDEEAARTLGRIGAARSRIRLALEALHAMEESIGEEHLASAITVSTAGQRPD